VLLTRGRASAYATPHSLWTPVESAYTPYAPCSHGKGAGGTRLDARGCGRVVTVCVARQASGPAIVGRLCPGVHAVDGGTKGPGDRARRRRAIQEYGQRFTPGMIGGVAWASSELCKCVLYRKQQYYNRQNLSSTVLAHAGYCMLAAKKKSAVDAHMGLYVRRTGNAK
jgi:hypothetical protein